jgi:RNA polymerase sigma-70 factor (ECF subfamily)
VRHETIESESAASSEPDNPNRCPDVLEKELVQLHEKEAAGLLRYAASFTGDNGLAQDAVQEVFLRYFVARTEGQRFSNSKGWLFKVLRNHLIDVERALQRKVEIGLDEIREPPDSAQDLDSQFRDREALRGLSAMLAPRELECVRLRAEGLRYEEIADVLAIRSGTVGALLARAHSKIRKHLQNEERAAERQDRLISESDPVGSPHAS